MSRVCVKNLPKYVEESRLREIFSSKGEITDAKLLRTKDGKSRQFAFVGFRTEEEAMAAIKYFNKSFLDTCRITCELALKVGDPTAPRPWSRYSKEKEDNSSKIDSNSTKISVNGGKNENKLKKIIKEKEDLDDPKLAEFLEVMQPRSKLKLWSNDDQVSADIANQKDRKSTRNLADMTDAKESNSINDLDKQNVNTGDKSLGIVSKNVSDMDYFKSRITRNWSDSESDGSEDGDVKDDDAENEVKHNCNGGSDIDRGTTPADSEGEVGKVEKPSSISDDLEKTDIQSNRLFIRNLPYTTIEEELEEFFSKLGDVSGVHVVVDKDTKRSKGFAYVEYATPEAAARALEELDKTIFQGRLLHIMPAKHKEQTSSHVTGNSELHDSKSFKQKKLEQRKASEASGNTKAWNSLFMRPDTVVENIARRHGISKSEFLNRGANDLAVRIALGETQVITETKKALEIAGVNVTSLEEFASGKKDGVKRSNHILLVKNLPYGSSESELAKMFGKFGNMDKVILPPTKTLAVVVFLEPSEARAAFRGLAYKRYKDTPLYLEWAPANILNPCSTSKDASAVVGEHELKRVKVGQAIGETLQNDADPDRIESRSLFVKNLNFKTTDDDLRQHIQEQLKEGKILSVKIKKHVKNGKKVSMGFGFLEFDSMETAANACQNMQGTVLNGHALILQLCHVRNESGVKKAEKDRSSTKLLVRNVAFEATEKDIRQLFSPFGQIKSVRLPMKFGNHRGFAFVEFVTKQEAQTAIEALSSTHLYGRHLVIERAKEGESLEELRARTAAQFADLHATLPDLAHLSKKRKANDLSDEGNAKSHRFDP